MKMLKKGLAILLGMTMTLTPVMAADEAAKYSGGTPWPDTDLKVNLPETADDLSPKDDFHLYVNYDWLKNMELKPGHTDVNQFSEVGELVEERVYALLESGEAGIHETELVQQYYQAYMDWESRDAAGVEPLRPYVEKIEAISNFEELTALFTDPELSVILPTSISVGNTPDFVDSSRYTFAVGEPSFLLQDPSEYPDRTEAGERRYQALKVYFETMMPRFGYSTEEADAILDGCISYENLLAGSAYTIEQQQSPEFIGMIYQNVVSYDELIAGFENFPMDGVIKACGYEGIQSVLNMNPAFCETLDASYTEENLELIRDYLLVRVIISNSSSLDREALNAILDCTNASNGSTGYLSDKELAYSAVNQTLAFPLSRAYVDYYDFADTRDRILALCESIKAEYREILQQEEWLTEETRQKAIEKLDAMMINAVWPEQWLDYSSLDLSGKSLLEMEMAIARHEMAENVSHTNGMVDKGIWLMSTTETNAYYSQQNNSINILAGILDGVFYHEGMTDEELYGSIGMIIAHEISHAFDPIGAQYDKDGNFTSWWTETDYAAFSEKAAKLIAYYDSIEIWSGVNCTGSSLQSEAVADLGGVKCMLNIINKNELDKKAFFESYAKIWAIVATGEMEEYLNRFDTHPLGYLRTNAVVQQYQEFYDVYDVQEGDGMYLAPEDRIVVW